MYYTPIIIPWFLYYFFRKSIRKGNTEHEKEYQSFCSINLAFIDLVLNSNLET